MSAAANTTHVQLKLSADWFMFASNWVGKKKQMDVDTKKIEAKVPFSMESFPRLQGPYWKESREDVILKMIGIAQEIEYPIVEI